MHSIKLKYLLNISRVGSLAHLIYSGQVGSGELTTIIDRAKLASNIITVDLLIIILVIKWSVLT